MKKQDGIALIATLLIMAAIMALGVGTLFLSTMNLKIAENSRTHAVARYNAEAGMEAALAQLKIDYKAVTPNQFKDSTYSASNPTGFRLPSSSSDTTVTYQLFTYTPYPTTGTPKTQARVVIIGTGPNNARYQTEALFGTSSSSGSSSSTPGNPNFPPGIVGEGVTTIKGNHKVYNARIHGNKGFALDGNGEGYYNCTENGVCTSLTGPDIPVSAARKEATDTYTYTCKSNNNLCDSSTQPKSFYLKDRVMIAAPPYVARRNAVFGTTSTTTTTETSLSGCTHTVSSLGSSYPAGSKVCVTRDVTLSNNRTYSNINIIVKGKLTIEANVTFNNTNVLSTNDLLIKGNATMNTSRLFSDKNVTLEGNVPYTGASTIAAGRNMNIKGNIEHSATNDIGMALIAVGNFTAEGNIEGRQTELVNVAAWVGGTATVKGNTKIRGGVAAKGNILIEGNVAVDGRGTFINGDLAGVDASQPAQAMEVTVFSRR